MLTYYCYITSYEYKSVRNSLNNTYRKQKSRRWNKPEVAKDNVCVRKVYIYDC